MEMVRGKMSLLRSEDLGCCWNCHSELKAVWEHVELTCGESQLYISDTGIFSEVKGFIQLTFGKHKVQTAWCSRGSDCDWELLVGGR